MVDLTVSKERKSENSVASRENIENFEILSADDAALARLENLRDETIMSQSQSAHWVRSWRKHVNKDIIIVASRGPEPFVVALEIALEGRTRIARFPGGRHANGNFPTIAPQADQKTICEALKSLPQAVSKHRPDIDILSLERQLHELDGVPNPLLSLGSGESPNIALAANLSGGFDALLSTVNAKRKKKRHRSDKRKFDVEGEVRIFSAQTSEENQRLLDFFFKAKAERFEKAGIADVFAEREIQAFFRALFAPSVAASTPGSTLEALEVGGELRAVIGLSRLHDRIVSEFGAIDDNNTAGAAPGEYLYFDSIQRASEAGFKIYDFSVGDEHYKRQWCKVEIVQYDSFIPLTARGRLAVGQHMAMSSLKRIIKRTPVLMNALKMARKLSR